MAEDDVTFMLSNYRRTIYGETEIIVENTIDHIKRWRNYGVIKEAIINYGDVRNLTENKYLKFRFYTKLGATIKFVAFKGRHDELSVAVKRGYHHSNQFEDMSHYEECVSVKFRYLKATPNQIKCVFADIFKNNVLFDMNIVSQIIVPFLF